MTNPLLAALQENYGEGLEVEDDVSTVRGLLSYTRRWLVGELEAEDLESPCLEMANRLAAGAAKTQSDLDSNEQLGPQMREPMEATIEAYTTLAELLEELPRIAEEEDLSTYRELIETFEAERAAVLDAQSLIHRLMNGDTKRCPGCGDALEQYECPECELMALYPDPGLLNSTHTQAASLPAVHGQVYRAFTAVMKGRQSLPFLLEQLEPLEEHLDKLLDAAKNLKNSPLRRQIQASLDGVKRIRAVEDNALMSELTRGWDEIFTAAVVSQRILRELAQEEGLLEEPHRNTEDVINVDGLD